MADILQIKRSLTASTVPSAGSLNEGELAVNIADKMLWVGDTSGDPVLLVDNGTQVVDAIDVVYDPTASGLTSLNVQDAIDEVMALFDGHVADTNNPHQTSWSNLLNIPSDFPPAPHGHDGGIF